MICASGMPATTLRIRPRTLETLFSGVVRCDQCSREMTTMPTFSPLPPPIMLMPSMFSA